MNVDTERLMNWIMTDYAYAAREKNNGKCSDMWHLLANGLGSTVLAHTAKDYANQLASVPKLYTKAGNYTTPYRRLLTEAVNTLVELAEDDNNYWTKNPDSLSA